MHIIWMLPKDERNYSARWRSIQSVFTHHWQGKVTIEVYASRRENST
jgi:hypothetical protein